MKIYLDDVRKTPEGWMPAKNFAEFKALIEEAKEKNEPVEAIDFDNDLGENAEGERETEGWEILNWLKDNYPEYIVGEGIELKVHSSNPKANDAMREKIAFWRAHPDEVLTERDRPYPFGEIEPR